jgi:malonyl CoA-acyl carrier protein transacylase
MARLGASGATSALEFGAGRVLAGLMRRINKGFKVRSVEDPASLRASGQALAEEAAHGA